MIAADASSLWATFFFPPAVAMCLCHCGIDTGQCGLTLLWVCELCVSACVLLMQNVVLETLVKMLLVLLTTQSFYTTNDIRTLPAALDLSHTLSHCLTL